MNTNQLLYETAYKLLLSMLPNGLKESDLDKYFVGDRYNPDSLTGVYKALIRTAQNYQFMPNVIQFDNREKEIGKILHDFNFEYVSSLNPDDLFVEFRKAFGISSEKSWLLWSKATVDSARYVKIFGSIEDFDKYVTNSKELKTVPLAISHKIRGIGFALACNALKELGYLDYVKPDIHLIDICDELNISSRDPMDVFDAMQKIASDNKVTPYKLDKVLWLVCSGNFYKDGVRVKGRKTELINQVKKLTNNTKPMVRVRKKHCNSDSTLQVKIEKILINKLEEKLGIPGLGNDKYITFYNDPDSKIKPDIYSSKDRIIGEVYSHIGSLKSAQIDKIAADVLKIVLFEEDSEENYQKYYVVCDEKVKEGMLGNAAIRNAVRLHKLKIECFELDEPLKNELMKTMKLQDITI